MGTAQAAERTILIFKLVLRKQKTVQTTKKAQRGGGNAACPTSADSKLMHSFYQPLAAGQPIYIYSFRCKCNIPSARPDIQIHHAPLHDFPSVCLCKRPGWAHLLTKQTIQTGNKASRTTQKEKVLEVIVTPTR